jgi:hypothetical protein
MILIAAVAGCAMAIGAWIEQPRAQDATITASMISGTVRWIKIDDAGMSFVISRNLATSENPKATSEPDPTVYFLPMTTKAFDGLNSLVHLSYLTGETVELTPGNIDTTGRTVVRGVALGVREMPRRPETRPNRSP